MTISELGSLGEFIASIAVLITLGVLVFQVRSARTDLSTQRTRDIKRHNNETFHQLTQNPGLMNIHIRAQKDFASLNDEEKMMWTVWMFTWITQTEDGYLAGRAGIPNMQWVDSYVLGVAMVLRTEGGRDIWARLRGFFDQRFVERLDEVIEEDSTTFLQALIG
jgi:hypothetical protein